MSDKLPDGMEWIMDIKFVDLLERDAALVYEHCGLDVLVKMWLNLSGITIYLGEKPLYEMKKRYIRQVFNKDVPEFTAKALALKLGVTERFVYEALTTVEKDDPRQARLAI